jgi:CheY-like chemotaxis protein/HPt (histidine-containing phosphotransfer) domain-containing protein
MVQQKALNKGLKLQIETSPDATPYLIGDPHRLCQIIVNLLNNAVKFTEQGEIVLETSLLIRLLDRIKLKFSIRDTGIGISAEQMQKLFQPFTQADGSITRKFGGTGLGLSISRQLAELMGGEIWCESTVGIGSSFIFTAWFGIGQVNDIESCSIATMSSNSIQQTFDLSGVNILLVEDNNINQQLVIEILKETNATVIVAENGSEAVTMTTTGSRHYDLVLMDIQMPIMDGYEATRLIKADKRFKDLPLIAMTAHALQKEHDKIMQAGMITHITKPINAQIMLQTIGEILGKQKTSMPLCELPADISDNDVAIPCIDGLDVSGALDNLGGDRNLYLWILHTFIESESNAALVIEAELHSGDAALAARHAHSIKGNAGAMGAMKLQELALSLEQSIIQGGSPESIQSSLELFSSELNRLVTELTYQLPLVAENLDDACSEELDLTVVTPILDVVLGYINSWDAKAEHYLDGYHDELSCLPGDDIVHIKNHLKKFDFAAARIALLELSGKYSIILSTDAKGENSQS